MAVFFAFLFGLIVGSFINVVIIRLRQKKSFLGRSICPSCKKLIKWHDNIPVVSFLLLRGKCRYCRKKISLQYPAIEIATGILFALVYIESGLLLFNLEIGGILILVRNFVLISILIIIFAYDLRWYLILDKVVLPGIMFALVMNLILGYGLMDLTLGILMGAGFFLVQFMVSRGKWIGGGDIRLGAFMGAILGWQLLLVAMFIAYVLGSVISVGLVISKKKKLHSKVPFGTFLSVSTIIAILYGDWILEWYLNIIL